MAGNTGGDQVTSVTQAGIAGAPQRFAKTPADPARTAMPRRWKAKKPRKSWRCEAS